MNTVYETEVFSELYKGCDSREKIWIDKINKSTNKAILISFGTKKEQQSIINHILANKERYLKFVD